jgi:hypothetical protein
LDIGRKYSILYAAFAATAANRQERLKRNRINQTIGKANELSETSDCLFL